MDGAPSDLRTLRYVAEITRKLAKMLSRTRYLLEMTAVEAESLAGEQDPKRTQPVKPSQARR
jgi:hypothetical protein